MTYALASSELAPRPALPRVLALAGVLVAAQSADAAFVWALCLAVGLLAHRLSARAAAQPAEALQAPRERAQPVRPTRRRNDAAKPSVPGPRPITAQPLLKTHRDNLSHVATADALAETAERLVQDLHARNHALCVLHVGIDGLAPLTESYGEEAGREVLMQVTRRLRHLMRSEDTVFRLREGEFVLLLSGPADESKPLLFAMKARVVAELQRSFAYRTLSNLHINCSVGYAIWPSDGASAQQVIHHAEASLADARARLSLARQAPVAQAA